MRYLLGMKTQLILTAMVTLSAALVTSCENPADKTANATIDGAQNELVGDGLKYVFTDSSKIEFTGSKVTGSHSGGFKSFEGHFFLNEGKETPNAGKFTIEMDSVWSDAEKLTGHLKSADFFDVEAHPTTTFTLTKVEKRSDHAYRLSGNFTLHGVTKNITFPAAAHKREGFARVQAEFDINRKDFGITYTGKADDLIRDEVVIRLDLVAKPEA